MRARLPPPGRTRPFPARSVESSSPPCPHATQPVRLLPYWDVSAIFVLPSLSRRVCSAPRRRGSPSRTNTLRPGGARRDPRCESVGGARVPALSGTAAGAERAQIRPPRVKEGGSDTAKRCFRGPTSSRSSLQKYLFTRSLPQVSGRLRSRRRRPGSWLQSAGTRPLCEYGSCQCTRLTGVSSEAGLCLITAVLEKTARNPATRAGEADFLLNGLKRVTPRACNLLNGKVSPQTSSFLKRS